MGKVENPNRLAHVEHVEVCRLGDDKRAQDQRRRFSDRHHESGHFRVGDGHRAPELDLPLEQGHDAAPTSHHVAKAHRPTAHRTAIREHDLFAQPLGAAHDGMLGSGFVGRDQDETLYTRRVRAAERVPGPDDVRQHGLDGMDLQHRNMLVRADVENDVWSLVGEQVDEQRAIHDRHEGFSEIDGGT